MEQATTHSTRRDITPRDIRGGLERAHELRAEALRECILAFRGAQKEGRRNPSMLEHQPLPI